MNYVILLNWAILLIIPVHRKLIPFFERRLDHHHLPVNIRNSNKWSNIRLVTRKTLFWNKRSSTLLDTQDNWVFKAACQCVKTHILLNLGLQIIQIGLLRIFWWVNAFKNCVLKNFSLYHIIILFRYWYKLRINLKVSMNSYIISLIFL